MSNHKKNLIIAPIIFLAFSVSAFFFVYSDIRAKNNAAERTLAKWQSEYANRENIRSLNQSVKDIAPQKALLETHFVESSDVVPFLNTVEGLGTEAKAQANITSVAVSTDTNPVLLVEVQATGSFESLYKFLMLMENSPYEIEVDSLDLQQSDALDASSGAWKADFKISLLSFIQ